MSIAAIIPVKCFDRAKSRLAPALSDKDRHALALTMFDHVARLAIASKRIESVLVVTDCDEVTETACQLGAKVMTDREGGLAASLDLALTTVRTDAAIILMGDLPHLAASDLDALIDALSERAVALAPDRQKEGTNALALRLPAPGPTAFGRYGSFDEHLRRFRGQGIEPAVVERDGLAFDVDAPEDLNLLATGYRSRQVAAL